jgi:hypothetical protein
VQLFQAKPAARQVMLVTMGPSVVGTTFQRLMEPWPQPQHAQLHVAVGQLHCCFTRLCAFLPSFGLVTTIHFWDPKQTFHALPTALTFLTETLACPHPAPNPT